MIKMNKRGQDLIFPIVIFLVLNIAFFSLMIVFVQRVSSNAIIYEEAYSKKVGLALNLAKPGMGLEIDITNLIEVALKNSIQPEEINRVINIDTEKGIVTVKARKEGGFNYPYFSKIKLDQNSESATTRINLNLDENGKVIGGTLYIKILE